jgi:hypothetical protein
MTLIEKLDTYLQRVGDRPRVLVKITTDDGIEGWAEVYNHGPDLAFPPLLNYLFEQIKGIDARRGFLPAPSASRPSPRSTMRCGTSPVKPPGSPFTSCSAAPSAIACGCTRASIPLRMSHNCWTGRLNSTRQPASPCSS